MSTYSSSLITSSRKPSPPILLTVNRTGAPFTLRRIEKRTCGKSQKIPEIRVGYFRKQGSFCSCLSLAFCGRRRRQNWQKAPELRAFCALLPSTLHRYIIFLVASNWLLGAPGASNLRKPAKRGPPVSRILHRREVTPPPAPRLPRQCWRNRLPNRRVPQR